MVEPIAPCHQSGCLDLAEDHQINNEYNEWIFFVQNMTK
jgi:hypothetical protein